jgi:hypothetical protein
MKPRQTRNSNKPEHEINMQHGSSSVRKAKSPPPNKRVKQDSYSTQNKGKQLTNFEMEKSIIQDTFISSNLQQQPKQLLQFQQNTPTASLPQKILTAPQSSTLNANMEVDKNAGSKVNISDNTNKNENTVDPIPIITFFEIAAPLSKIRGRSVNLRLRNVRNCFMPHMDVANVVLREYNKQKYVVVQLISEQDMHNALKMEISFSEMEEKFHFEEVTKIKPPPTDEQKHDLKERTLQVIDIPLNVPARTVRATMSRFGTIIKLTMRTRNLFQHAFITYENKESIDRFKYEDWSVLILKDAVRVLPLSLDQEERNRRQHHCYKLAGLPAGTQARDLMEYLSKIKAKSCFIPRNPSNYRPLNYAFINFATEEDQIAAGATEHSYKSHVLYWCHEQAKTCNICGSPDHFFKSCPNKPTRSAFDEKKRKLYERFRPAQHRHKKSQQKRQHLQSYADVVKKPIPSRTTNLNKYDEQQNIKNGTAAGGSMHDPSNKFFNKQKQEITNLIAEMKQLFNSTVLLVEGFKRSQVTSPSNSQSQSPIDITVDQPKKINQNQSKRSISDVDTTTGSDSSFEDNDNPINRVEKKLDQNVSTMKNLLNTALNAFANITATTSYPGGDLEEVDEDEGMEEDDEDAAPIVF